MNCWFVIPHRGVACLERVVGRWEDSIDWYHLCLNEKRFTLSDVVLKTNTKKHLQSSKLQTPGGMVFVNACNTKASAPKRCFLKMFGIAPKFPLSDVAQGWTALKNNSYAIRPNTSVVDLIWQHQQTSLPLWCFIIYTPRNAYNKEAAPECCFLEMS